MAVFGELVLIGIGVLITAWAILAGIASSAFSGKTEWSVTLPSLFIGILIIWASVHYGVITIGVNNA